MKRNIITTVLLLCISLMAIGSGRWVEEGKASHYSREFHGKETASGETHSSKKLTAAHKTLPIGTMVRVTNLANGRSVDVRINDRGPFVEGRIIDLTEKAFDKIGDRSQGVIDVRVEVIE